MKPALDKDFKELLFALYHNQRVVPRYKTLHRAKPELSFNRAYVLQLRPLSDITDEEAIQTAKRTLHLDWGNYFKQYPKVDRSSKGFIDVSSRYNSASITIDLDDGEINAYDGDGIMGTASCIWAYNYLISQGFALPFHGVEVNEMVEAGFITLKSKQSDEQKENDITTDAP